MILTEGNKPTAKQFKSMYTIDLNEGPYTSIPFLKFTFKTLVNRFGDSEKKYTKRDVDKIIDSWDGKTLKQIVQAMNKHLSKNVLFYYGPGDEDPADSLPVRASVRTTTPKKTPKKKTATTKKKTSGIVSETQTALEENMRKTTKKG